MKKIIVLVLIFASTLGLLHGAARNPFFGGNTINPEEISTNLHKHLTHLKDFEKQFDASFDANTIKQKQETHRAILEHLLKNKQSMDADSFNKAYDFNTHEINRLQRELDRLHNNGDKIFNLATDLYGGIAKAAINQMNEEQTRKTQVAVVGVKTEIEQQAAGERFKLGLEAMTNAENLKKTGFFLGLTSTGIIASYYLLAYIYRYFEILLGRPQLVSESSRSSMWGDITSWMYGAKTDDTIFDDIVLPASVEPQLKHIAHITKQAHLTGLPLHNVLLYGQPGTGKTMFARKLAYYSDMDYAIVPGGNFAQFKEHGQDVTELNKLFDWANNSKRGLVLLFDEADAFLEKRNELLNTFLYHTGTSSKKILIILTTNRPSHINGAVHSRITQSIHIPLPNEEERLKLLNLYFAKYITDDKRTILQNNQEVEARITVDASINLEQLLKETAAKMNNFSGRKIEQFIDELRSQAYYNNCVLTKALFDTILKQKMETKDVLKSYDETFDEMTTY